MALIRVSWRLLESTESSGWAQGKHGIDVLFSSPCAGLYATSAIPQCSQARPGPTAHTLSRPRLNPVPQGQPQPHAAPVSNLIPQLNPGLGMSQGSTKGGWCLLRVAGNCPPRRPSVPRRHSDRCPAARTGQQDPGSFL